MLFVFNDLSTSNNNIIKKPWSKQTENIISTEKTD